jgi:uncharacterized protein
MSDRAYIETPGSDLSYQGQLQRAWATNMMELTIMPTENCNFRCTYCYEDFSIGRMSQETVSRVKSLISHRIPELSRLHISWFGGEPLAAADVVLEISEHIQPLVQEHDVAYTAHMTTNGSLLTLERFNRLVKLGVNNYQISLDGPKEYHDLTRLTAGKEGSYDRIMQNLKELRASDIPGQVMIRLHITEANQNSLEPFVRFLSRHFLDDPRFSLFFVPIGKLGGPNDENIQVVNPQKVNALIETLVAAVREEQSLALDLDSPTILGEPDNLSSQETDILDVCYASRPNALVIRADGRLGKCTVALNSDRNAIGKLLPDGLLEIDNEKHHSWITGWFNGDKNYLKCPAGIF